MSHPHQPPPDGGDSRDALTRRRLEILEATVAVCAEKGYPEASVADIAKRAGMGVEGFRRVFPDKEEAFLGLLSIEEKQFLDQVEDGCGKAHGGAASRVERGLRSALEWVDENPRDARVCIVEPTRATTRIFERREQTLDRLADLLREHGPRREIAPELLEELLVAGVCEVLGGRLSTGHASRAVDLAPELTELLLGTYLPPS
jgi:AcrR family transcriptional regulator